MKFLVPFWLHGANLACLEPKLHVLFRPGSDSDLRVIVWFESDEVCRCSGAFRAQNPKRFYSQTSTERLDELQTWLSVKGKSRTDYQCDNIHTVRGNKSCGLKNGSCGA